jgi:hypothetical protein
MEAGNPYGWNFTVFEALEVIRQHGFDPATVISQYQNFLERDAGIIAVDELRKVIAALQEQVDAHRQVISKYEELERNDFGLKELKQLAHTVKEIAEANGISRLSHHRFCSPN